MSTKLLRIQKDLLKRELSREFPEELKSERSYLIKRYCKLVFAIKEAEEKQNIKLILGIEKFIKSYATVLSLLFLVSCASVPEKPTWRNAYLNRKPVTVYEGVPLYAEHSEYIKREVNYMCLAGIKPMLPAEFSNKQALDFCGCMADKYFTKQQLQEGLVSIDFNPTEFVKQLKNIQNEYWAVLDDQFRNDYREIAKYPPNYYEKITSDRANCIDDVNYKVYTGK